MEQARMNVRQLLESRVRQHPAKAFLIFEDQVISYADFDTTVNRVACGFLRLGIGAGDQLRRKAWPQVPQRMVVASMVFFATRMMNGGLQAQTALRLRELLSPSSSPAGGVPPGGAGRRMMPRRWMRTARSCSTSAA